MLSIISGIVLPELEHGPKSDQAFGVNCQATEEKCTGNTNNKDAKDGQGMSKSCGEKQDEGSSVFNK